MFQNSCCAFIGTLVRKNQFTNLQLLPACAVGPASVGGSDDHRNGQDVIREMLESRPRPEPHQVCALVFWPPFPGWRRRLCKSKRTRPYLAGALPVPAGRSGCAPVSVSRPTAAGSARPCGAMPQWFRGGAVPVASEWFCSCTHDASRFQLHPKCERVKLTAGITGTSVLQGRVDNTEEIGEKLFQKVARLSRWKGIYEWGV